MQGTVASRDSTGPTLAGALALVPHPASLAIGPLRLPVQDIYLTGARRIVVGRIESGRLRVGDSVVVGAGDVVARVAAFEESPASTRTEAVPDRSVVPSIISFLPQIPPACGGV